MIDETKERYTNKLSKKLDDPSTMSKAYCSILNTFLNNKKIPNFPPLNVNGKIISNFDKKVEPFNSYFASQCTSSNNSSVAPPLEYKTNWRLASVNVKEDDVYLLSKSLNLSRMIQLYGKAIVEPLQILFLSFLEESVYPDDWKKSNVLPIHKKESKNLIKNYGPISLLPVFSKVFERIIFNSLFNDFLENKLFNECKSGLLPTHSCTSEFLSITHKMYKSFGCNPSVDVKGNLIDISKSFDGIWHDGLIYKLKLYGVEKIPLNLIQYF